MDLGASMDGTPPLRGAYGASFAVAACQRGEQYRSMPAPLGGRAAIRGGGPPANHRHEVGSMGTVNANCRRGAGDRSAPSHSGGDWSSIARSQDSEVFTCMSAAACASD